MRVEGVSIKILRGLCGFFLATMIGPLAQAELQHQCGKDTAHTVEYSWCIDSEQGSRNTDVLYYFHGAGRSEQGWKDEPDNQAIRAEWLKKGIGAPTVISVSFGAFWMLSEVPRSDRPGLYRIFVDEIMPFLESKIGGVRGRRLLKGESMGGFNGSQLLLKASSLFDRVALVCPAIPVIGPQATPAEIDAFVDRHKPHVRKELVQGMWLWTQQEFPSEKDWSTHSPLSLVRQMAPTSPKVYVSCGEQDEFGFFEGSKTFAKHAQSRGVKIKWQPIAGGHCVNDPVAIAQFLSP